MKSKIRVSIVGGCSQSMKDKEGTQNVHPFSLLHLSFSLRLLLVSSEKRALQVSPFEKRKENLSYRSCILLPGGTLYFGSSVIFRILRRAHTFTLLYGALKKDAIGMQYNFICTSAFNFFVTDHILWYSLRIARSASLIILYTHNWKRVLISFSVQRRNTRVSVCLMVFSFSLQTA